MSRLAVLVVAASVTAACSDASPPSIGPMEVPVYDHGAGVGAGGTAGNFGTALHPREEVMPAGVVNTSRAVGNASFRLNDDGSSLSYKLIVANIRNPFMAHIHSAPVGVNGGIVVWLFPSTAPGVQGPLGAGRMQGVIAEGTITAANLVGSLSGRPLSALVDLIAGGGAYVNVHTNDGQGAVNTGPGDYPQGEVRGQIEARGHH